MLVFSAVAGCTALTGADGLSAQGEAPAIADDGGGGEDGPPSSLPEAGSTETSTPKGDDAGVRFVDDFERADGFLGNGWILKTPNSFVLFGGKAVRDPGSIDYHDAIVYRPPAENVRDVEAILEFEIFDTAALPQVLVRVNDVGAGSFDGYLLYVNGNPSQATLTRQRGDGFHEVRSDFPLSPALTVGQRYRFRLRATSAQPVSLFAAVERATQGGNWVSIGETNAQDDDVEQITAAGSVGFGTHDTALHAYPYFERIAF